ncbi:hypothetical protein BDP27DRAFT_1368079 [Rhodocollybia butyracea]|uniref:Uncharacterized protein n=1 Tax=Rhodocollybia butyracea TaxID=206335 RepID=A0A9P5U174_9AGAR|nr:hypothetical protein BDP27DRAFT_1368079 [Rhodocollybia butyracea]
MTRTQPTKVIIERGDNIISHEASRDAPHEYFLSALSNSVDRSGSASPSPDHPRTVPRPRGEPYRRGRGGYNLDEAANWTVEQSKEIKKYIKHVVETDLDCTLPFTKQPSNSIDSIRKAALLKFPWLLNYIDLWVVDVLVRYRLQLRQAALKKTENALLAAEARARASRKAALQAAAANLD